MTSAPSASSVHPGSAGSAATSPGLVPPPELILPAKVTEILARIGEPGLQEQVGATVRYALGALQDLQRIHLPQDDFEEHDAATQVAHRHLDIAPYALAAVSSMNRLLSYLMHTFPAPAESSGAAMDAGFDLEFDLVDGPTGEGSGLAATPVPTGHAAHGPQSPSEQVADAAHAFGHMLRGRIVLFGDRLQHATSQSDSWPLLAELDDNKHKLTKCVQAVLFGVLGVFGEDARREEILPDYRSAVSEAVQLRSALADLSYHVNRFNAAIGRATAGETVPLVVALSDRLSRFSGRPEYRTLRAEDKKAVIDFRRALHALRHRKEGVPMAPLRLAVEGFSKFLESMQAINHREVLVIHDRQRLQEALQQLDAGIDADDEVRAVAILEDVINGLAVVSGRNPELDDARRAYIPVDTETVSDHLTRWRALVEGTFSRL